MTPEEKKALEVGEWTMPEGTYLRLMSDLCILLGKAWEAAEKGSESFGEWYVGISPLIKSMVTKSYSTPTKLVMTPEEKKALEDKVIHYMRIGLDYQEDRDGSGRFFGERETAQAIIKLLQKP